MLAIHHLASSVGTWEELGDKVSLLRRGAVCLQGQQRADNSRGPFERLPPSKSDIQHNYITAGHRVRPIRAEFLNADLFLRSRELAELSS